MKTYLAKWPNGTISIVSARLHNDLYLQLDKEADPEKADVYEVPKPFHITTDVKNGKIYTDSFMECDPFIKKVNLLSA